MRSLIRLLPRSQSRLENLSFANLLTQVAWMEGGEGGEREGVIVMRVLFVHDFIIIPTITTRSILSARLITSLCTCECQNNQISPFLQA